MTIRRLAEIQPESFAFTAQSKAWVDRQIAKYPERRQASAVIPLLWQAQKQNDYWLPKAAIESVAEMLGMPFIRVFEIATFYTMFNLAPVGKFYVQLCGTTPCMLRGSDDIKAVLRERVGEPGHVSADGVFSWQEVECLGACCNAPMVQINDDYFEDLTAENFTKLLDDLAAGRDVHIGSQTGRVTSEPVGRLTTLVSLYGEDGKSGPAVAQASPTPLDFPGREAAAPTVEPQAPDGGADRSSSQPTEHASTTQARAQDEAGRPDAAGQRSDPRQENPVGALGAGQDGTAHDAAKKA